MCVCVCREHAHWCILHKTSERNHWVKKRADAPISPHLLKDTVIEIAEVDARHADEQFHWRAIPLPHIPSIIDLVTTSKSHSLGLAPYHIHIHIQLPE